MELIKKLMVKPGSKANLGNWDPDCTGKYENKEQAIPVMDKLAVRIAKLQYLLFAENKRAMLVVLQAMDAGGKDGTIRTVMGPMNPQGCKVTSFKEPTDEELAHDFLWRVHRFVPRKGEVRIFNRSHYEDVLIVRVHNLVPKSIWSMRFEQINNFEKLLVESDIHVIKFFLHISKNEQKKRFKERLDDPTKHWKANPGDFEERKYWEEYTKAYEDVLTKCSTDYAPWYVIPANHKWFRNVAISEILVHEFEKLKMKFPEPRYDISKLKIK
ncbi:MAG TPA: polyphosphate kinase 2 family protein [Sedimentisphaerales bacterium]